MPTSPFRSTPPLSLLEAILLPLNVTIKQLPTEIQKSRTITYKWSVEHIEELMPYYIPCMLERFFKDDYPINTITIIRHLLKEHNMELKTHEAMIDYKKYSVYHISKKIDNDRPTDIILSFD
jgi:hypothetical protein